MRLFSNLIIIMITFIHFINKKKGLTNGQNTFLFVEVNNFYFIIIINDTSTPNCVREIRLNILLFILYIILLLKCVIE